MSHSFGSFGAFCVADNAMAAYGSDHPHVFAGKPLWTQAARCTDFKVPIHRSCTALCGNRLANDGSGCHPRSSTALMMSNALSDLTMMCGLYCPETP